MHSDALTGTEAQRTGNLAAVMRTMGHKDVKTAMQYQHPELEIVRAALVQDKVVEYRVVGLSHGTLYCTPKTSTSVSDGKDGGRGRNRTFNLLFGRQTLKMNDFKESQ